MYLTPTKNHWIIDIETDGLRDEATKIFVVCVENAVDDRRFEFRTREDFNSWLDRGFLLCGHNAVAFDIPVLNNLWNAGIGIRRVVDTMVLSMLYSPNLAGGHSLEAWGERLKCRKLEHKDFSKYSEEMLEYCKNDVRVTKLLWSRLSRRMRDVGFTERGAEIETLAWHIIQNKQRRYGFPFDIKRAHELYASLRQKQEDLKNEIYKHWPPKLDRVAEFKKPFRKDGSPSSQYERHLQQFPKVELKGEGYVAYDWVEFNLGSPKQRVEKLLEAGWVPTKFTKRTKKGGGGNPKVDEDSLAEFAKSSGNDGARALAKWVVVFSRANMIGNWIDNYNEKTGAIHGNLWIAGSLRYRHDNPNSANIPSVRVDDVGHPLLGEAGSWTYEARDLWTCGDREKYSLVGIDAKSMQMRNLAHWLDDENFTKAVLAKDPHAANRDAWGLPAGDAGRKLAKTLYYAIVMGAGGGRIASEAKISLKEAKATKKQLFDRVPGFPKLINSLQTQHRRTGRIRLCDGTPVLVPEDYQVIPYLLQGDESKLMKQASIYLDEEIRKNKFDARKVGDIHDEWQFVVLTEQLGVFIETALACFPRAGKSFDYQIPIEGDAKVGKTWAETH